MQAEQAVRDRVERAAPHPTGLGRRHALGAREHLAGGAPAEGEQQDAFGPDALVEQPGDAGGERRGLARAGAGHDQQRAVAVGRRRSLGVVEVVSEHVFGNTTPGEAGT